jgi:hypothetical protein
MAHVALGRVCLELADLRLFFALLVVAGPRVDQAAAKKQERPAEFDWRKDPGLLGRDPDEMLDVVLDPEAFALAKPGAESISAQALTAAHASHLWYIGSSLSSARANESSVRCEVRDRTTLAPLFTIWHAGVSYVACGCAIWPHLSRTQRRQHHNIADLLLVDVHHDGWRSRAQLIDRQGALADVQVLADGRAMLCKRFGVGGASHDPQRCCTCFSMHHRALRLRRKH